jgi:hypothetical protein
MSSGLNFSQASTSLTVAVTTIFGIPTPSGRASRPVPRTPTQCVGGIMRVRSTAWSWMRTAALEHVEGD